MGFPRPAFSQRYHQRGAPEIAAKEQAQQAKHRISAEWRRENDQEHDSAEQRQASSGSQIPFAGYRPWAVYRVDEGALRRRPKDIDQYRQNTGDATSEQDQQRCTRHEGNYSTQKKDKRLPHAR